MIVFHGTTEIIEKPDLLHSKIYLDFGKGFYLTTYQEQAEKWAIRKGMRQGKQPLLIPIRWMIVGTVIVSYLLKKKMKYGR